MQVIGTGIGRTGTYSLKLAINQLGLGPCHHMEEVILNIQKTEHRLNTLYTNLLPIFHSRFLLQNRLFVHDQKKYKLNHSPL